MSGKSEGNTEEKWVKEGKKRQRDKIKKRRGKKRTVKKEEKKREGDSENKRAKKERMNLESDRKRENENKKKE